MSQDKVWERKQRILEIQRRAWARLGIEDPHQVLGENATRQDVMEQVPATPGVYLPLSGGLLKYWMQKMVGAKQKLGKHIRP